jgi:hypothetical protein
MSDNANEKPAPLEEGFPAALIRVSVEKLAEKLEMLHKSVESGNKEEIQSAITEAYKGIDGTMTFLRIFRKEIKKIEKAQQQPTKPPTPKPTDIEKREP